LISGQSAEKIKPCRPGRCGKQRLTYDDGNQKSQGIVLKQVMSRALAASHDSLITVVLTLPV